MQSEKREKRSGRVNEDEGLTPKISKNINRPSLVFSCDMNHGRDIILFNTKTMVSFNLQVALWGAEREEETHTSSD